MDAKQFADNQSTLGRLLTAAALALLALAAGMIYNIIDHWAATAGRYARLLDADTPATGGLPLGRE